jgi:hypothetical protein
VSLKFAPQIRASRTIQNINSDPFDRLRANGIVPDSSLPPFVLSVSNHERNCLTSHALRQAQGERIMTKSSVTQH